MNTTRNELTNEHRQLLQDWLRRARESQHSHHEAGKINRICGLAVEAPAVLLPFSLGAMALLFVGKDVPNSVSVGMGIAGVGASVLTSIQLYFRFHEVAAAHISLGARYGIVRRNIEMILNLGVAEPESDLTFASVKNKLDSLAIEPPVVPSWIFRMTLIKLAKKDS